MPTLHGTLPDQPGPTSPCRWCGAPTDLTFAPEGSRVGPVPLHMLGSGAFILAFERMKGGLKISDRDAGRVARMLGDGHAAAASRRSQETIAPDARPAPPER